MPITVEGKLKLEEKLKTLKVEFSGLPKLIGEARAKGDLKENAEYHAAKERQGMLNAAIQKLNYELTHCQVIDIQTLPKDIITFGKRVNLLDKDVQKQIEYIILGANEANVEENKISISSLVAKGLLGKKIHDEVVIEVPSGKKRYKVIEITSYEPASRNG